MRKKLITIAVAFVGCLAAIGLLVACDNTPETVPHQSYFCTVTFDAGVGTITPKGDHMYTVDVEKNACVRRPTEIPKRAGYAFWGWNTTGDLYTPMWKFDEERITRDMTIYAVWVEEFTVTFRTEEGTFSDGADAYTVTAAYGTKLTEPKLTNIDATRELQYWTTASGVKWNFSADTVPYGNFMLYAQWDFKRSYKKALLPFNYGKASDGCYYIQSVADKNVSGALTVPSVITRINPEAFMGCKNLVSVVIEDGVTSIDRNAFEGCTALRQIRLPDTLTKLDYMAFSGCTALLQIRLPDTLTTLGDSAFRGCTALKSVELGGVTEVPYNAFYGCSSLSAVAFGAEVRAIRAGAFGYCVGLTEIDIPDTVTQLDPAFANCTNLRSVNIGDGIDTINSNTFVYCYNLRSVSIGSGVKEIKNNAFSDCQSLLSITIPTNVTAVGNTAFVGCCKLAEVYNLTSLSLDNVGYSHTTVHTDASDASILHTTDDGFTFWQYNNEICLLDYVGDDKDIVLPDSYNGESYSIFNYALSHKPRLKSVKLSLGVKDIGRNILFGSDNVTSLTVDGGNAKYHAAGNCVIDTADKKFVLGCKTSIIPTDGSVTVIGSNVFCHNATIVNAAFKIPDSVTNVEDDAFEDCVGIMRTAADGVIYVDKWMYSVLGSSIDTEPIDIELEEGTVGICDSALYFNTSYYVREALRSVRFNAELKYVGSYAFAGCKKLTDIAMNDGLLSIGEYAFFLCGSLQEAVIPDSVNTVGSCVFYECANLKYVKLPAGITEIGGYMFRKCSALEMVVIPQSVTFIQNGTFMDGPDTVGIYYCGTEEQWNAVRIASYDNTAIVNATKYFYSETEIAGVNCWHYGADGKPTTEYN